MIVTREVLTGSNRDRRDWVCWQQSQSGKIGGRGGVRWRKVLGKCWQRTMEEPSPHFLKDKSTYCSKRFITIQSTDFHPILCFDVILSVWNKAVNQTDEILPSWSLCSHGIEDNSQICYLKQHLW